MRSLCSRIRSVRWTVVVLKGTADLRSAPDSEGSKQHSTVYVVQLVVVDVGEYPHRAARDKSFDQLGHHHPSREVQYAFFGTVAQLLQVPVEVYPSRTVPSVILEGHACIFGDGAPPPYLQSSR